MSTPSMLSSGKLIPTSTMIALVLVSKTVIFAPISPSPPSGVIRTVSSLRLAFLSGCRRSSWISLFCAIASSIAFCHGSLPVRLFGIFERFLCFFFFCESEEFVSSATLEFAPFALLPLGFARPSRFKFEPPAPFSLFFGYAPPKCAPFAPFECTAFELPFDEPPEEFDPLREPFFEPFERTEFCPFFAPLFL